jgi:hypothetical protein
MVMFIYIGIYYCLFDLVLYWWYYNQTDYLSTIHTQQEQLELYVPKSLVYALLWTVAGDCKLKSRKELGEFIRGVTTIPLPPGTQMAIIDFEVSFKWKSIDVIADSLIIIWGHR